MALLAWLTAALVLLASTWHGAPTHDQYDAWGRLLQVNQASRPGGPGSTVVPGELVKHHTYDGLGRLVCTQSPYPKPWQSGGQLRSERFYYDGIRRIQEIVLDSLSDMAMAGGDPQLEEILDETTPNSEELDGDTATLGYEEGQAAAGGGGGGPVWRGIAREYIWGPGDNGVDELLVQYDEQGYEWWAVQDAGGDLVALCDTGGSGGTARVVGQWLYDAYGAVVTAEHLHALTLPHLGHKGLFFDRLDAGVVNSGGVENPRLVPFARALYHVRNRNYDPGMGRWNQRDPHCGGLTLISSLCYHGEAPHPSLCSLELEGMHADGANLYQYLGSNAMRGADPLGLYDAEDGYEDIDDLMNLRRPLPVSGDFVTGMLRALAEDYATNLAFDLEWTESWGLPDDDHSRTDDLWIALALGRGLYEAFDIGLPGTDKSVNPLDVFGAKKKKKSNGGSRANSKAGHTIHVRKGQRAHHGYQEVLIKLGFTPPEWKFEFPIDGIGRVDAINIKKRIVRELKPNTPSGRARGLKQLIGTSEKPRRGRCAKNRSSSSCV